jgi:hypothetical protein
MAFYHTTCLFASKNKQRAEIYSAALKSWENVKVRKNHIHESAFSRNSETELGDTERKLVFIKDVINYRFSSLKKNDYIILSNLDIFVCADFIERAKEMLKQTDAFFAQRKDIALSQAFDIVGSKKVLKKFEEQDLAQIAPFGINVDLVCFSKSWWVKNRSEIPDFLMGAELWDLTFPHFIKASQFGGAQIRLDNCIYHVRHSDTKAHTNTTNPSSRHNRTIAVECLEKKFGIGHDKKSLWLNKGFTQHMVENFGFTANINRKGFDTYFINAQNEIRT